MLVGATLLVALMNATRLLAPSGWLYLSGQITAGELLQRQFTTWEEVRLWINENVSATARVLFTGEEGRLCARAHSSHRHQDGRVQSVPRA